MNKSIQVNAAKVILITSRQLNLKPPIPLKN